MKNLMSATIKTLGVLFLFCLNTSFTSVSCAVDHTFSQPFSPCQTSTQYSWSEIGHASSYVVILTSRTSASPIIMSTVNHSISLTGIPSGTYRVKVYGVFSNKNSFVIVEDTIVVGRNKKKVDPSKSPMKSSVD